MKKKLQWLMKKENLQCPLLVSADETKICFKYYLGSNQDLVATSPSVKVVKPATPKVGQASMLSPWHTVSPCTESIHEKTLTSLYIWSIGKNTKKFCYSEVKGTLRFTCILLYSYCLIYRIFQKLGQYFFSLTRGPHPIHHFTLLIFFLLNLIWNFAKMYSNLQ